MRAGKTAPFRDFDVIIDLNLIEPDRFNDKKIDPVNVFGQLFALLSIWNASLSDKEVVICSATIGPYKNPVLRSLARRILNNVSLISLREEFSRDYLESIEVKKPKIQVTADLAFLMESDNDVDPAKVSEVFDVDADSTTVVGICPAAMMNSMLPEDEYIRLISEVSDFLIEDIGATIFYIANTFQDIDLVDKIYRVVDNPQKTRIVPFSASATEVKSVIGLCDLFICSRFHALVASTSLGVPSIGLVSYSYNKVHGIIGKMMGQEEYLLDIDQTFEYGAFFNELRLKSEKILHDKESVRANLLKNCASTKKQALVNGYLIRDLVLANDNATGD
jgi:polysaccharide pyruvyl transferase WcaK-like protein